MNNKYTYYVGDDNRLQKMVETRSIIGNTVRLTGPTVVRHEIQKKEDGDGYYISDNLHEVSYVRCHIGGFTKFVRTSDPETVKPYRRGGPSKTRPDINTGWVGGRDVIG